MIETASYINLLESTMPDVCQRVARLKVMRTDSARLNIMDTSSLVINIKGDYSMIIVWCAENSVLRIITEQMKRQQSITLDDIIIYTPEFYNIFCGMFVSKLNTLLHAKARFGIPQFINGLYIEAAKREPNSEVYFKTSCGFMKLEIYQYPS